MFLCEVSNEELSKSPAQLKRVFDTYLAPNPTTSLEGAVATVAQAAGISYASIEEVLQLRIPVASVYATLVDAVWLEVETRGAELPASASWPSIRRALVGDDCKIELLTVLENSLYRSLYEASLGSQLPDLHCLHCWSEVRQLLERLESDPSTFVPIDVAVDGPDSLKPVRAVSVDGDKSRFSASGAELGSSLRSASMFSDSRSGSSAGNSTIGATSGDNITTPGKTFFRRWGARVSMVASSDARKALIVGTGSSANNAIAATKLGEEFADPIAALKTLLSAARVLQPKYFSSGGVSKIGGVSTASPTAPTVPLASNAASAATSLSSGGSDTAAKVALGTPNCGIAGVSETLRLELAATLTMAASVRLNDIESVDEAFAAACAGRLLRLLRNVERETFQYLQLRYPYFLESTEFALLVANIKADESLAVQRYETMLEFLKKRLPEEKTVSWTDPEAQGCTSVFLHEGGAGASPCMCAPNTAVVALRWSMCCKQPMRSLSSTQMPMPPLQSHPPSTPASPTARAGQASNLFPKGLSRRPPYTFHDAHIWSGDSLSMQLGGPISLRSVQLDAVFGEVPDQERPAFDGSIGTISETVSPSQEKVSVVSEGEKREAAGPCIAEGLACAAYDLACEALQLHGIAPATSFERSEGEASRSYLVSLLLDAMSPLALGIVPLLSQLQQSGAWSEKEELTREAALSQDRLLHVSVCIRFNAVDDPDAGAISLTAAFDDAARTPRLSLLRSIAKAVAFGDSACCSDTIRLNPMASADIDTSRQFGTMTDPHRTEAFEREGHLAVELRETLLELYACATPGAGGQLHDIQPFPQGGQTVIDRKLGPCDFPLFVAVSTLSLRITIQILLLLLTNRSIVLVATSPTLLVHIMAALPRLVWPFRLHATHTHKLFLSTSAMESWLHSLPAEASPGAQASGWLVSVVSSAFAALSPTARDLLTSSLRGGGGHAHGGIYVFDVDSGKEPMLDNSSSQLLAAASLSSRQPLSPRDRSPPTTAVSKLCDSNLFKRLNSQSYTRLAHAITNAGRYLSHQAGSHNTSEARTLSNRLVETGFVDFFAAIFLRFVAPTTRLYPKQHVISCDVKALLVGMVEDDMDMEREFCTELVGLGCPAFLDLLYRHGHALLSLGR